MFSIFIYFPLSVTHTISSVLFVTLVCRMVVTRIDTEHYKMSSYLLIVIDVRATEDTTEDTDYYSIDDIKQ